MGSQDQARCLLRESEPPVRLTNRVDQPSIDPSSPLDWATWLPEPSRDDRFHAGPHERSEMGYVLEGIDCSTFGTKSLDVLRDEKIIIAVLARSEHDDRLAIVQSSLDLLFDGIGLLIYDVQH